MSNDTISRSRVGEIVYQITVDHELLVAKVVSKSGSWYTLRYLSDGSTGKVNGLTMWWLSEDEAWNWWVAYCEAEYRWRLKAQSPFAEDAMNRLTAAIRARAGWISPTSWPGVRVTFCDASSLMQIDEYLPAVPRVGETIHLQLDDSPLDEFEKHAPDGWDGTFLRVEAVRWDVCDPGCPRGVSVDVSWSTPDGYIE